ncbi:MAG: glycoside hydrolase family 9 protein [Acidobacteria bacterium]|nr:glycoside hydrolase family 9 protein [Acidobacteriota bacterium]
MTKKIGALLILWLLSGITALHAEATLQAIHSASNDVLVAFIAGDSTDVHAVKIEDKSLWKINGKPAAEIFIYATAADPCDYHVFLKTSRLEEGAQYRVETPYGGKTIRFREREIFCEAIKTNQSGYSAFSRTRYANFAVWLGTGGAQKIEGVLPSYEVFEPETNKTIASGTLTEIGKDGGSGDYVYRIDLAAVPEGGPYKIAVHGYGSSHSFGVGGEFSKRLAHVLFRAQYLQRCGCPIHNPDIRKNACHTLIYDVDGPIGEANIDVKGDERTFKVYGGYHDAGDADRRAYHMSNPVINLMIYEAFPEYFTDGQYDIPGDFDEEYRILNYTNGVPDLMDEAAWGTLVWEYLQNDDGSIHFGTETRRYPDPFAAPLDLDDKKYGTVKIDARATSVGAGLFMHLARMIKPYDSKRSETLVKRAEKAMEFESKTMADPERLYYHIQRYLLLRDDADHRKIKELYRIAGGLKENLFLTPGYSLNDARFDNPAYILSYILEDEIPADREIVDFFKQAIKDAADANIAELRRHAYPVGNNPDGMAWGHNVRQPQYAAAPLLQWKLSGDRGYFDAASELMDYKTGLNPIGISYVTALGFHRVHNVHDRESAYTISKGWGPKPGITVFGPGVTGWNRDIRVIPPIEELPKERQYVDDREIISFNEFTIFETMHYDALYTILAGGGKWDGKDPFASDD